MDTLRIIALVAALGLVCWAMCKKESFVPASSYAPLASNVAPDNSDETNFAAFGQQPVAPLAAPSIASQYGKTQAAMSQSLLNNIARAMPSGYSSMVANPTQYAGILHPASVVTIPQIQKANNHELGHLSNAIRGQVQITRNDHVAVIEKSKYEGNRAGNGNGIYSQHIAETAQRNGVVSGAPVFHQDSQRAAHNFVQEQEVIMS
jgi:hypothetical protein